MRQERVYQPLKLFRNFTEPNFSAFRYLDRIGAGKSWGGVMTGHTQLAVTPRDRLLEAAQEELAALLSPSIRSRIAELGIKLVSYTDFAMPLTKT